jgi:hypothetical protein
MQCSDIRDDGFGSAIRQVRTQGREMLVPSSRPNDRLQLCQDDAVADELAIFVSCKIAMIGTQTLNEGIGCSQEVRDG